MADHNNFALGIDIGTTSVKVCIVNVDNHEIIAKHCKDPQSNIASRQGTDGSKQDVMKIISALNTCVAKLNKDLLRHVRRIGICGQMHGVMLFQHTRESPAWNRHERDGMLIRYDVNPDKVSALYTWQDNRCDSDFLASLPVAQSHLPTFSGYGIATIYWMLKNAPAKLRQYNYAASVQDFVVMMLCDLSMPVTSAQLAASWGYFNCTINRWNEQILEDSGFPVEMLPTVMKSGVKAGCLADDWHSIPKGTPVAVALGDLQCSVFSTLEKRSDAILNISTSAQLTFIASGFELPNEYEAPVVRPIEYIPYFNGLYLAVAASLNGGNALATFVRMLQQWCLDLGFAIPQSKVWEKLLALATNAETDMMIEPTLLGERTLGVLNNNFASATHITLGNLQLGQVFRALCQGLLRNLHAKMPRDTLIDAHIERIVGNGSGLTRNKILQDEVQKLYQLPFVFTSGGDAAKGAALGSYLVVFE